MKTLDAVLSAMRELGFPAFAVYGEGDEIAAIVFAVSGDALRITMALPERWEVGEFK